MFVVRFAVFAAHGACGGSARGSPEGIPRFNNIECQYFNILQGLAESESLTALACSCLLSLVVARGDTGKMLSAVASLLMSSPALASQHIRVLLNELC